ncbi:MAG: hypothetical protein IKO72_05445 [Kiritimatiellae bacterium]|nr:hypothetical protein [Kiritimatiellia bacterium]
MKKSLAVVLAVVALAALGDYSLFIGGYPPPPAAHLSTTGAATTVALAMQAPAPSAAGGLDSRYRVSEASNASSLSSLPPAICIIIR